MFPKRTPRTKQGFASNSNIVKAEQMCAEELRDRICAKARELFYGDGAILNKIKKVQAGFVSTASVHI